VSGSPTPDAREAGASGQDGLTSVIVVAADSGAGAAECIGRVLDSTTAIEVIVVDNASTDGCVDAVASRWAGDARVRILRNAQNLGFGTGCNRGAALATGDELVFLNPDCAVAPDTFSRLRAASDLVPGLLGVDIVDADGVSEPASRRRDPLLRRALMAITGLARFERRWPALAGVVLPPASNRPPLEDVDAVSGALMYLPRAVFDRVGGFDEGYFLHAEDLDLCRRVRDAGMRVACVNAIRVMHGKGGSSRHRPLFVARHKHRGMWRWFVKFDSAARNPLLRTAVWIGLWLHFAALLPVNAWRQATAQR
jgi:N-acetylglucosaminyl-diphospho-decaprenol L-rhamnosyltransferase